MADPSLSGATAARARARRRLRQRLGGAALVTVVAGALVAVIIVRAGPARAQYRLAAVTTGSVTQQVQQPGRVASGSRNDASFAIGGTVARVDVQVGDRVAPGAVLATLYTADLASAVTDAKNTLESAQQQLADDLQAQQDAAASSAATTATSSSEATPTATGRVPAASGNSADDGHANGGLTGNKGAGGHGDTPAIPTTSTAPTSVSRSAPTSPTFDPGARRPPESATSAIPSAAPTHPGGGGGSGSDNLRRAQQAVIADQKAVTAASNRAAQAQSAVTNACTPGVLAPGSGGQTGTTSTGPTETRTSDGTTGAPDTVTVTAAPVTETQTETTTATTTVTSTVTGTTTVSATTSEPDDSTTSPDAPATVTAPPPSSSSDTPAALRGPGATAPFAADGRSGDPSHRRGPTDLPASAASSTAPTTSATSTAAAGSPTPDESELQVCRDALADLMSQQQAVGAAQDTLTGSIAGLTSALSGAQGGGGSGRDHGQVSESAPTIDTTPPSRSTSPGRGRTSGGGDTGQPASRGTDNRGTANQNGGDRNSSNPNSSNPNGGNRNNSNQNSGGTGNQNTGIGGPVSGQTSGTRASGTAQNGASVRAQGGPGPQSQVPTAADIASDQANIEVANYDIAIAQQNLSRATLTAPIGGSIAAVAISPGDRVTAGSAGAVITIVGTGEHIVTTTVPLSVVDSVRVGNDAALTVNGIAPALTGKVTYVGTLTSANGGTASTTTYPITIAVDPIDTQLFDGSGAMVTLTVASVNGVLTVPTSAVANDAGRYTVEVADGTIVTTATVTVGAIGPDRIQILSGLTRGQQVVLADLSAAIPTSTRQNGNAGLLGGNQAGNRVVGRFGG